MAKRAPLEAPELTDRERILTNIILGLSMTQVLGPGTRTLWESAHFRDLVHFAPWDKAKPGDLVLATTGGTNRWTVGWYVEDLPGDYGGGVIREIGTGALCNYSNETFRPIRNLAPLELLEGEQRQFYLKVLKAFARGDEYLYRFGGLTFDGASASIRIREAHGGFGSPSHPFLVNLQWTRRTSVATILRTMREQGYGTRSFRQAEASNG